jgi:hypothetical protein
MKSKTSRVKNWFLQLLSYITFRPLFKGNGMTHDPVFSIMKDPVAELGLNTFHQLRADLGPFEIRSVIHEATGKVRYVVYHVASDTEYKMSKDGFEFFFEPYKHPVLPPAATPKKP